MDLKQLEYIVAIAECGNISRAAETLFITQSGLNQQLIKLEKELGQQLFYRNKHYLRTTQAGKLYIDSAKEILRIKKNTFIPVAGTAFDFRSPRHPDAAIRASRDELSCSQIHIGKGYNHAYLLNRPNPFRSVRSIRHTQPLKKACVLRDISSGRTLKLMTDAPALVLYTGGYLPEHLLLSNSQYSHPSCAIALEARTCLMSCTSCQMLTTSPPHHSLFTG